MPATNLLLQFAPGNRWTDATWIIESAEAQSLRASDVEEIGALGGPIAVEVSDGDGGRHGPFAAEAVMTGYPHGALCFVFRQTEIGYWKGVTVAISFGKVAVVPYEFDPM